MYNHIWKKYVPFINIHLKRSVAGEQTLSLNSIDFERSGTAKKTGSKFTIHFTNGKVTNIISGHRLAVDLAAVLLEDENTKSILKDKEYEIKLNTKYQLSIKNLAPTEANLEPAVQQEEEVEN